MTAVALTAVAERPRAGTAALAPVTAPGRGAVALRGVIKAHGHGRRRVVALDGIDLAVVPGEFVSLIGASGSGKSTLLNLVAGLDAPTSGTIEVDGRPALMFQDGALFPWLTVRRNVELALRLQHVAKPQRRARVEELLGVVGLDGFADRRPHELSGGMRQRVALARALAQHTEVLCMDEPFASLDAMTRAVLHDEVERLWLRTRATTLFVTHDVTEAVRLADRVVVLTSRPGRVAAEVRVPLERPRRLESTDVADLASEVAAHLRREVGARGAR